MLTDGVNQYYDHVGGYGRTDGDGDSDPFGSDYSAYDRVDAGRLGTTDVGDAVDEVDDRMEATCTAMKDEGIILYTITFQVNNTSTQDLFRRCATSPLALLSNSPSKRGVGPRLQGYRRGNSAIFGSPSEAGLPSTASDNQPN